jgi:hypothetical protein
MGLGDFVTDADAVGAAAMMLNDDNFGGGGMGAESGYDNQQMDADDY